MNLKSTNGGGNPKNTLFFSFEKLKKNVFVKTLQIFFGYECEEKAITLTDGYLTFSKDSSLVAKDLYVLNLGKFICNLNLFVCLTK